LEDTLVTVELTEHDIHTIGLSFIDLARYICFSDYKITDDDRYLKLGQLIIQTIQIIDETKPSQAVSNINTLINYTHKIVPSIFIIRALTRAKIFYETLDKLNNSDESQPYRIQGIMM
jgi:hypothetical protein